MNLVAVLDLWARAGVTIRAGASEAQIATLVSRSPYPIPASFLRYLRSVDGIDLGEWGPESIRFWPLEEILESMELDVDARCIYLGFADYLLNSEVFYVRLDSRTDQIVIRIESGDRLIAPSLDDFMTLYVTDPAAVLLLCR